jgi:hypothetical protein
LRVFQQSLIDYDEDYLPATFGNCKKGYPLWIALLG